MNNGPDAFELHARQPDNVEKASVQVEDSALASAQASRDDEHLQAGPTRRTRLTGKFSHIWELFERPDPSSRLQNPLVLLRLSPRQAYTFSVAFLGWMVDAIDFFCVSMSTTELGDAFGVEPSRVTSAITVTLMLRPVGALVFGVIADRHGRRIPLMVNLFLFTIIELASGFSHNLSTFIGLRAVYGILMGGEWGLGSSLAMEALP
ncbi:Carboxylic acid transporter, partial [Coemansia sp. RSA 2675]